MPINYTVDVKGLEYVVVETTDFEKLRITVMLSIWLMRGN
jgi:hypothetical protein